MDAFFVTVPFILNLTQSSHITSCLHCHVIIKLFLIEEGLYCITCINCMSIVLMLFKLLADNTNNITEILTYSFNF